MKTIKLECIQHRGRSFSCTRTYSWNDFESQKTLFGKSKPPQRVCDFQEFLKSNHLLYVSKKDVRNSYGTTSYSLSFEINVSEQYSSSIFESWKFSDNIFVENKGVIFDEANIFCKKILSSRQAELVQLADVFERGAGDITHCQITNHDNIGCSFSSLNLKNLETNAERLGLALAIASIVARKSEDCFYLITTYAQSHASITKLVYKKETALENW